MPMEACVRANPALAGTTRLALVVSFATHLALKMARSYVCRAGSLSERDMAAVRAVVRDEAERSGVGRAESDEVAARLLRALCTQPESGVKSMTPRAGLRARACADGTRAARWETSRRTARSSGPCADDAGDAAGLPPSARGEPSVDAPAAPAAERAEMWCREPGWGPAPAEANAGGGGGARRSATAATREAATSAIASTAFSIYQ